MGGGKKKKNGRSSTADQKKDRQKRLKQEFSQTESAIKHILSKSCLPNVTLSILYLGLPGIK
jgi:hypothetical protein